MDNGCRSLSRRSLCCGFLVLFCSGFAAAQYGSAPPNVYPSSYGGSTFKGTLVKATEDTIVLVYTHGKKVESFEGRIAAPCGFRNKDNKVHLSAASGIPLGTVMTALFEGSTTVVNGEKKKENKIIGISFQEFEGKMIKPERQGLFFCIPTGTMMSFKPFH